MPNLAGNFARINFRENHHLSFFVFFLATKDLRRTPPGSGTSFRVANIGPKKDAGPIGRRPPPAYTSFPKNMGGSSNKFLLICSKSKRPQMTTPRLLANTHTLDSRLSSMFYGDDTGHARFCRLRTHNTRPLSSDLA